jgi:hypothetical protein
MKYNIYLGTCDPQSLDAIPSEWKDSLLIDLEPVEGREYDAAFVYERLDHPVTFKVREGNVVFIPGEPQSIKGFGTPFLRQFDKVMSFRHDLNHPNYIKGLVPCLTLWRVGLDESLEKEGKPRHIRSAAEIMSSSIQKSKFMSMIVSNKPGTPLQRARMKLAKTLSEHYPGLVDIYGRGIRDIKDKAEALDPYLFSIAVENSYIPNYITEKLTDCFVTATVPLYSGCPNVDNYYASGIISIDPWDIEGTIKLIIEISQNPMEVYQKHINAVICQRHNLIYKHSIIARIYDYVSKSGMRQVVDKHLESDQVGYFW